MANLLGSSLALSRPDRTSFFMSDDNIILKQIEATHVSDVIDVDVRPLLTIAKDILNRSTPSSLTMYTADAKKIDEGEPEQGLLTSILETLLCTIDRISCEIACKSTSHSDIHTTALSLLQMLANYPWDAKLVLIMAAFALNYGEFWLLAQIHTTNSLARSMAALKKLPELMEHWIRLRPRFDALRGLINAMLAVTDCVVSFKELPGEYISQEDASHVAFKASMANVAYWTIRATLVCASQITNLCCLGHDYMTTETWDLSILTHKIASVHQHLDGQLAACHKQIEARRNKEAFEMLRMLFETVHLDNLRVLKALICADDDVLPLVDGSTKLKVGLEVVRKKMVLLLISGLDMKAEEVSLLEHVYTESKQLAERTENQYEMVWIPVASGGEGRERVEEEAFRNLQSMMPWYTVCEPKLIQPAVVRFVKEVWRYQEKAIIVVLDPHSKVVSPNAIPMMWIWGSASFPFTTAREDSLWKEEEWRLDLIVNGIDPDISKWIREKRYIMIYGGEETEWMRKVTRGVRKLGEEVGVEVEMVYVGRSGGREQQVRKAVEVIETERLSNCWKEGAMVWFFWARLESMLVSKIQQGKVDEYDSVTLELKRLLSFDKEGGWAVLSHGSKVLVNGHWLTVLSTLLEYEVWRGRVGEVGLDAAIREHHQKLHDADLPCCRFEFPASTTRRIPDHLRCPECRSFMQKHVTFLCCHDHD